MKYTFIYTKFHVSPNLSSTLIYLKKKIVQGSKPTKNTRCVHHVTRDLLEKDNQPAQHDVLTFFLEKHVVKKHKKIQRNPKKSIGLIRDSRS